MQEESCSVTNSLDWKTHCFYCQWLPPWKGERLQNMLGDSNLTGFVGLLLNRREEKYNLEGGVP